MNRRERANAIDYAGMTPQQMLDAWWEVEPFGWDNPDTYAGIKDLMWKAMNYQAEVLRIEKACDKSWESSHDVFRN